MIREAWIVREATRRAAEIADECIALWPYVSLLAGRGENWAHRLLHRLDTQAGDARLLIWQWIRRFDRAGEGHRVELERAGLDLKAARSLISGASTISTEGPADTQTALAPIQRRRRRQDVMRLRRQLQSVSRSIDEFETALHSTRANPYR
ncbi:MAG: hypothetical protein B7733_15830 [Myxococcales bacterium FL481]|nr:MAG: hypothetical protein B7733_15830 [Myxococcales bacterium FL481]